MKNSIEINGKQVIDLTPENAREVALVDLKVLKRLTNLLGNESFSNIRHTLRTNIMATDNLEQLVELCEDFTSFHRSVNLVQSYMAGKFNSNVESCEDTVKVVGHIDLDDIDTCARDHSDY